MKKIYIILLLLFPLLTVAQTGAEFWFVAPEVTSQHGDEPIYFRFATGDQAADITIAMPADPSFTPINISLAPNSAHNEDMTSYKSTLENQPTDAILNKGILVQSTNPITAYYEVSRSNNCDIFALKGANALGMEFFTPFQTDYSNHVYASPPLAYAAIDIVATEDNTTVLIYPKNAVDGHPAQQQYSITLDRGETYSCGWTGSNYDDPATHPQGTMILSDKPIAVSVKDDSEHHDTGPCYDLMGDQLVPTNIIGKEYIALKGNLNGTERLYILAVENNTQVFIDGVYQTTLFATETYSYVLSDDATFVECSKPVYALHASGWGCEKGEALLPPLNCAGSEQIFFTRATDENFFLNVMIKTGAESGFKINGDSTLLQSTDFDTVPNTNGEWMAARKAFSTTEIPTNTSMRITNSLDIFSMGLINGGATSGCRFGYFSEFVSEINVEAGTNQTICANTTATLDGSVSGGATEGIWTCDGLGTFEPNNSTLDAEYIPSLEDIANGTVNFTLTSVSQCFPESDNMTITITPAPTVEAGDDIEVCENNATASLNGSVSVAVGGEWSGGNGTFVNSTSLSTDYTLSADEIAAGTVTLYLTSTGNGNCNPEMDSVTITTTPAPMIDAGENQTVCANDPEVTLQGNVTGAGGGEWTGGTGIFNPSNTTPNAIYTPSASEISVGTVILTFTSTGNGNCSSVSDQMTITITPSPIVDAGSNQTICENNAEISLNGSVTDGSTTGRWTGGLGTFTPNDSALNATYTPTPAEIASGGITLTLTSINNGNCIAVSDDMDITFTSKPIVEAGTNETVCGNNAEISLSGSVSGGSATGLWSGGNGIFSNPTNLNASYQPSVDEINVGNVILYLSSTNNGNCLTEIDSIEITITPAPIVEAGDPQIACSNNPEVTLEGSVSGGSTTGIWSGGLGAFYPGATSLGADYTPTTAEITSGSATLTLTSTSNGDCLAESDDITITFGPPPNVDAGADQSVCANNKVYLNGSISGASGGEWSGGLGVFSPDRYTLNAVYTPTPDEILAGNMTLTLTSTGNGNCNPVSDNLDVTFTPAPTVNAGSDITVCANNSNVGLNGTVTVASGGNWSTNGTGYFSNVSNLNATYYPSEADKTSGHVRLKLTSTGNGNCIAVADSMNLYITPAPIVEAGSNIIICADDTVVQLNGSIAGGSSTGQWFTFGSGTFNNSIDPNAVYYVSSGDIAAQQVNLTLTSTNNGNCFAVSDSMQILIYPEGVADAGTDQTVCANNAAVSLNGVVTGGASGGQWNSSGTGTFIPSNTNLNATYIPSNADIIIGSVILTLTANSCDNAQDQMEITITPAPVVSAGQDKIVCVDELDIQLNGQVSAGSSTGVWTTTGSGNFTPNNTTLNAVYHASSADSLNGEVDLILTSTANGSCIPEDDTIHIDINPAGVVNAGSDMTVCSNNASINLNGSISGGASKGVWTSSGTGYFTPADTSLSASYVPSNSDTASGSVMLKLTATNSCNSATDSLYITFTPGPTAYAGIDQEVCGNNSSILLNGTVSIASGGFWSSSGTGAFSPNNTQLTGITYIPSAQDILDETIYISLTTTGNGNCNPSKDSLKLTISPPPIVDAGNNQMICIASDNTQLQGSISGATTTGRWTTLGSGTFSNDLALDATYEFSAADTAAGQASLILTSTNNGNCMAEDDTLTIFFGDSPFVDAGEDISVCIDNISAIPLNGLVTGGTSTGIWTTNGTGSFLPADTVLNAVYDFSSADSASGNVQLFLTSTNNGSCNQNSDTLSINVEPLPQVFAGSDQDICEGDTVFLSGSVIDAIGGSWGSSGNGTFYPNDTTLDAQYIPGYQDTGFVYITLYSRGNIDCATTADTLIIDVTPAGYVDAGINKTACANNADVQLNGIVYGGASEGIWTSSGTGSFSPDNTVMNPIYTPSAADTANGGVSIYLTATNSCNPVSDSLTISYTDIPIVIAGENQTVCANNSNVYLDGYVEIANGGTWSTSGTGYFTPNNNVLNATYIASETDIATGSVNLYLTSIGNGNCNPVTDNLTVTFAPAPEVNAGSDQEVCSSASETMLNGSVSGGTTTGIWQTLGSGSFGNTTDLVTPYYFSNADTTAGMVQLILTSTNNGDCAAVKDTMLITFGDKAFADAGENQFICADMINNVQLNGFVSGGSSTGIWSTLGSGTFDDPSDLNTGYDFSTPDSIFGFVNLVLTSTNNGDCLPGVDTVMIATQEIPVVNAGNSQTVCETASSTQLNGSISGATTTGYWTTSGSGSFIPDSTNLSAIYQFSSSDTTLSAITMTLTSTNSDICAERSDNMTITFGNTTNADAGEDQTICASDADTVQLSGNVSGGASYGVWSTSGSGTFFPSDTVFNPQYIISTADSIDGMIEIYLESLAAGGCGADMDTMLLIIEPIPLALAGEDITICSINDTINLNGTSLNSNIAFWNSSGSGYFYPTDTTLNTSYIPSLQDSLNGTIQIYLTALGLGACEFGYDTIDVSIVSALNPKFATRNACVGEETQFYDSTEIYYGNILHWNWAFGDGGADTNRNPVYTYNSTGNFDVTLQVTSNLGCDYSQTNSVYINAVPVSNFGPLTNCLTDSIPFADSSFIIGGSIADWIWTFGDGDSAFIQNPYHPYSSTGTYTITLMAVSDSGCHSISAKDYTFFPSPDADFFASDGCEGETISFEDASVFNDGIIESWQWLLGDGNIVNVQNPMYAYQKDSIYYPKLIVESDNGCSDSITKALNIYAMPNAEFTYDTSILMIGEPIQFFNQSSEAQSYTWDFGDNLGASTTENPLYTYEEPGLYNVVLIALNQIICSDSSSVPLTINNRENVYAPRVPSGFTPNDDGNNDILRVMGGPFSEFEFVIFNKLGHQVFKTNNPDEGWDGTKNSYLQPIGVYFYTVKAKTIEGDEFVRSGDITLIR